MQYDLSVIIPANSEIFLSGTIERLLQQIRGNTEIIAVLDGAWANPPIKQDKRVNVVYLPESVGQRAATNIGVKLSKSKYIMKLDAHCTWDEGLDVKMIDFMREVGDDVTAVPIMRNLWMFSWKCYKCGWKKYQGPTPKKCDQCGSTGHMKRKMMWVGKHNPQSTSFCFDSEPHFQYFEDWKHREPYKTDKATKGYTETMSLQGSAFMCTRERYWALKLCDEVDFPSWGSQGIEVACKTWLSGGRVLVNHKTWYAHMFRTQGGDFSFPYKQHQSKVNEAKKKAKELFFNNQWTLQKYPLSWLIKKFWPVKGWSQEDLDKITPST